MKIDSGLTLKAVQGKTKDVIVHINDPKTLKYKICIRDENGKYMGDAFVMLRNSWREWIRFMKGKSVLKLAIP